MISIIYRYHISYYYIFFILDVCDVWQTRHLAGRQCEISIISRTIFNNNNIKKGTLCNLHFLDNSVDKILIFTILILIRFINKNLTFILLLNYKIKCMNIYNEKYVFMIKSYDFFKFNLMNLE